MPSEIEYINYKEFVETLSTTESLTGSDKVVVSNPTDGPRSMPGSAKDRSTAITTFRTGDVIPVDGPSGPAKMGKDDLLNETSQNAKNYSYYTDSVANGENIASIDTGYLGQLVFAFRGIGVHAGINGIVIVNRRALNTESHIDYFSSYQYDLSNTIKLYVDSNGASVVRNVSGYTLDVKVISCTERFSVSRNNPATWDESSKLEYGTFVQFSDDESVVLKTKKTVQIDTGENVGYMSSTYGGQILFSFRGIANNGAVSGLAIVNRFRTTSETHISYISSYDFNLSDYFKLYMDSNGFVVIRNISGGSFEVNVLSCTEYWTVSKVNPTGWGEDGKQEYGKYKPYSDDDYLLGKIDEKIYYANYTFSVANGENIASIDTGYLGQLVFAFRGIGVHAGINGIVIVNRRALNTESHIDYFSSYQYDLSNTIKLYVDSNGASVVRNVSGYTLDVKVISCTERFSVSRNNPATWDESSKLEYGTFVQFSDDESVVLKTKKTVQIDTGENVGYMSSTYGGQILFSFRGIANNGAVSGLAIVNRFRTTSETHISYISSYNFNLSDYFKLYMDSNGFVVIRNISGGSFEVNVLSCTEYWTVSKINPTGWDEDGKQEYGKFDKLGYNAPYSQAAMANINSLKFVVNASRFNKDSSNKHDFTFCIVTDSHDDWKSVQNAVNITNDFLPIDICIHCGDVGNDIAYGTESLAAWNNVVSLARKPLYFVVGNHEAGAYPNIGLTPTQEQLYKTFIKPLVDRGFLTNNDYTENKCYYMHDFDAQKVRLVVLNEFEAPQDIDTTYWDPITYDSTKPNVAANTSYAVGDVVNVENYTSYSFMCKLDLNTGVYYSNYWPKYKILCKKRWFTKTQLDWFAGVLNATPENYSVIIAVHQPLSPNSKNQASLMFGDTEYGNNAPGAHIQSVMSGDIISDIINAFKNKGSYSATITGTGEGSYLTSFSVSYDFSNANDITNVLAIGGHAHKDLLWKHDTYTYLYNVTPTTSCTTSNDNYKICNEMRLKTSESEYCCDSLTCISFGHLNRIALTKIGVDVTINAEPRNFEIINT